MEIRLGQQQANKEKQQLVSEITGKLNQVDNIEALKVLSKALDKPGMAGKLVKNKFFILNF